MHIVFFITNLQVSTPPSILVPGPSNFENELKQLSQEVFQLKKSSQRIEQDLMGAKNDVGNVQVGIF